MTWPSHTGTFEHLLTTFWSHQNLSYVWETMKIKCSQKRDLGVLRHLSFWVSGVELPLILFIQKKKKIYMIEMLHCHWLNKNKYKLDKLNFTRIWVLVTIYQKNTCLFCPSYNLPKNKRKTRHRSTYPREKNSEGRLQNGKVLGTHSAQTEYGLLDSNDQYSLFALCKWYVEHNTLNQNWLT